MENLICSYHMRRNAVVILVLCGLLPCFAIDRGLFGDFRRSLNTTGYGYRVIPDPTGGAPAALVEAFEVRPGDAGRDEYYDDSKNDRERSELSEIDKNQLPGSEYWYGWYLYFPENHPNVHPTKVTLGQFHQKDSHPAWMFEHDAEGYRLYDQVFGRTRSIYRLIDEKDLRVRWHRIEIHVRWSKNGDGFFAVWIDGAMKVEYRGQTMDADRAYFKYGVYRAFVSRYKAAAGAAEVPAQTVYYACVKKGMTREAIQP